MPRYAFYDAAASDPKPVRGWYDTDALVYPNLPAITSLFSMTDAQWAARLNSHTWAILGGSLVEYTPPATLVQMASAALAAGLSVTSTSTPALSGTYDISPASQGRMAAVSTYILVNAKFPGGVTSYGWVDTSGAAHVFPTTASFQAFATAIADYVSVLDQIIVTGSGTIPPASKAIP